MGRGNAAVIVGDSKQMPPTTTMQASHGGDGDTGGIGAEGTAVPEDLDSILSESVESLLPRHSLTWHYRSQDETLIVFSNRHYYNDELSSLPSPGHRPGTGVAWRRVNGRFDRGATRTNQIEAEAVVTEITRRLHEPDPDAGQASIGVVTFNIQQRDLILDLLEDSPDPLVRQHLTDAVPEPIFVKNLENVQGDERDVILFSLAFSTDPATGQLPLNFGPLSQIGGERRLNVAVTRARRQVILFASFVPRYIDLNRTAAVGTRHLRLYC
jgi:superfamily I DNA and/or RNA helicase